MIFTPFHLDLSLLDWMLSGARDSNLFIQNRFTKNGVTKL